MKNILVAAAAGAAVFAASLLCSCSGGKVKVSGELDDAESGMIVVERPDYSGRWVPVDSVEAGRGGRFSLSLVPPGNAEVYRLRVGARYVYFPVDSAADIRVGGTTAAYTLTGSPAAEAMSAFDRELAAAIAAGNDLAVFKRSAFDKYMRDARGNLMSYYALTKTVGDTLLYNPADAADCKYYAAVATAFRQYRPDDPRGKMLENVAMSAMRKRNAGLGRQRVVAAQEISMLDIELPDASGHIRKLSDVAGKGKTVVVVFAPLTHKESPALNRALASLRQSKGGRLEIFHVGFDTDVAAWREAAVNLPWITVYEPQPQASKVAADYNITSFPAFFVYSPEGELISGVADFEALSASLVAC